MDVSSALSTTDGKSIWDFNTAQEVATREQGAGAWRRDLRVGRRGFGRNGVLSAPLCHHKRTIRRQMCCSLFHAVFLQRGIEAVSKLDRSGLVWSGLI
jgi:hypothetical protein